MARTHSRACGTSSRPIPPRWCSRESRTVRYQDRPARRSITAQPSEGGARRCAHQSRSRYAGRASSTVTRIRRARSVTGTPQGSAGTIRESSLTAMTRQLPHATPCAPPSAGHAPEAHPHEEPTAGSPCQPSPAPRPSCEPYPFAADSSVPRPSAPVSAKSADASGRSDRAVGPGVSRETRFRRDRATRRKLRANIITCCFTTYYAL
jgi:hypothetical protein